MYYNIIFLLLCFIALTKAITINIVVQSFFSYSELYQLIINDFNNRYVKENNLDIKLKLNLFTEQNSTIGKDFYSSTIDTLLNKKSHKYDVFIYDPLFTRRYAPYFIDLKKYLPKEIIDSYSSDETINSGYYKDQCVGLPVYVKYKLLYSNINLLNKYNRTIPETWDELVETTKIVLEGERATNNNDLIGFSNLFPKNDITMCSLYEYLYSFRETKDSPIPEFNSKIALDAMNKLDKIKNETSSTDLFTMDENYAIMYMISGNSVFSSYFDIIGLPGYTMSEMPGEIKGIHGSCLTGYNIGIAKFIPEKNLEASIEVVKYFASAYVQKNFFVKIFNCYTAMKSLYVDEEICSILDCELAKKIQSIPRPSSLVDDYDSYSSKVVNYVYEFFFNKRPVKDILNSIDNLTRIHYFTMHSDYGLVAFISLIITFFLVIFSTILLFIPLLKRYFRFLSIESWILHIVGFLLIIASTALSMGELSLLKCNLKIILFSNGYALVYVPFLQKLITNYPIGNTFTKWVKKHRLLFMFSIFFAEILYNLLYLASPYLLAEHIYDNENNHYSCQHKNTFSLLLIIIKIIFHSLIYLYIIILIFLEWNINDSYHEIRDLSIMMSASFPSLIVLLIINFFETSRFEVFYLIQIYVTIIYIISSHFFMFYIRTIKYKIFSRFGKMSDIDRLSHDFFKNNNSNSFKFVMNSSIVTSNSEIENQGSDTFQTKTFDSSKIKNKVVSCHYTTSVK